MVQVADSLDGLYHSAAAPRESEEERRQYVLKYIELKTGYNDNGPAWIGLVQVSKSGRTIYFNGRALKKGSGVSGNFHDLETGDEYWVSGVKRDGSDRHWAGSGKVLIEAAAVDEYLRIIGKPELDKSRFTITTAIRKTNPADFVELENRPL
jgi:hypothetical protein